MKLESKLLSSQYIHLYINICMCFVCEIKFVNNMLLLFCGVASIHPDHPINQTIHQGPSKGLVWTPIDLYHDHGLRFIYNKLLFNTLYWFPDSLLLLFAAFAMIYDNIAFWDGVRIEYCAYVVWAHALNMPLSVSIFFWVLCLRNYWNAQLA